MVRWVPADVLIVARAFQGLPSANAIAGAMACALRLPGAGPTSVPVAVHVEALTDDGRHTRPRFRKDRGPKTGAAFIVRASDMDGAGPIHVAEGEADVLAIAWWRRVEAWGAGGSSGVLPKLALPLLLTGREIIIETDGDTSGHAAAGNASGQHRQRNATVDALVGIGPKDELEGMMAAQLIAAHNAAMECYRRAMIGEQTFEGRRENLNQANKLSRTWAMLLDALNKHRGKGHQKVTVEHVHVHAGGQAVVGNVVRPGGGDRGTVIDVIPEISPEELERNDFDAATVRRAEAA